MTRFEKRMIAVVGLLILLFAFLEASAPKPTDWKPSFSRYHIKPFGGRLLYERLTDLFPDVRPTHDPVATSQGDKHDPANRIFITGTFGLDAVNTGALLDLVEMGDRVLIAAEDMQNVLADTLHIQMRTAHRVDEEATSDIRCIGDARIVPGVFRFARHFPGAYFTRYDSSRTRVLAVDGASRPVLLEMAWGYGRIVLCSAPRALSNYYLLKNDNAAFAAAVLSTLPPRPVVWDEFYKVGRPESSSFIRFLLKEPALRWAWFLGLSLIVLFMLVFARRQQRPIPTVHPPNNASRELAHTIGRLYWHRADHAGMARKLIAHFKEEVRARTYLRSFAYDEATIAHLAAKTGRDTEDIGARLRAFQRRETATHLNEGELLALSTELHEFRQLIH